MEAGSWFGGVEGARRGGEKSAENLGDHWVARGRGFLTGAGTRLGCLTVQQGLVSIADESSSAHTVSPP